MAFVFFIYLDDFRYLPRFLLSFLISDYSVFCLHRGGGGSFFLLHCFISFFFFTPTHVCTVNRISLLLSSKQARLDVDSEKTADVGTWGRPMVDPGPRVSPISRYYFLIIPAEPQKSRCICLGRQNSRGWVRASLRSRGRYSPCFVRLAGDAMEMLVEGETRIFPSRHHATFFPFCFPVLPRMAPLGGRRGGIFFIIYIAAVHRFWCLLG